MRLWVGPRVEVVAIGTFVGWARPAREPNVRGMSQSTSGRVTHDGTSLPHRAPNADARVRVVQLTQEFVHLAEEDRDPFFDSLSPAEQSAVAELIHRQAAVYRQQAVVYAAAADSIEGRVGGRTHVGPDEIARESAQRRSARRPARRRSSGR